MNKEKAVVKVCIDQTDLNEVLQKCERLSELLKEARSLAGELASLAVNVSVDV